MDNNTNKVPASFDAKDWAEKFNDMLVIKGYQPYDPGQLTSWFADALMRGYDEGIKAYVGSSKKHNDKIYSKTRIIKRTMPDGRGEYVIQQKHWLFRWKWTDAWINSMLGSSCKDSFPTLEEAKKNLCYFDGSKVKEEVVDL